MKKLWIAAGLLMGLLTGLHAETSGTYRVGIAPVKNMTPGREDQLSLVIQNSIATFLGQIGYLQVSKMDFPAGSSVEAMRQAASQSNDIALDSSYSIIGDTIYIHVRVFDLLKEQLKFQKTYSGAAGVDIFDTLDIIIAGLKTDITAAVPPLPEETLVEYRKQVRRVTDDIKIKRYFVTSLGVNGSFYDYNTYQPYLAMDLKLDWWSLGMSCFMPLLVPYEDEQDYWRNNLVCVYAGFCWQNWTFSAGSMITFSPISGTTEGQGGPVYTTPGPYLAVSYRFGDFLCLKAGGALCFSDEILDGESVMVPVGLIGCDFYPLPEWGIRLDLYYTRFSVPDPLGYTNYGGNLIVQLGLNYRVEFKD